MKKAHVYSASVNGTFTQLKAYKKENAVRRFQQLDASVRAADVRTVNTQNSQQAAVEELYPEICQ